MMSQHLMRALQNACEREGGIAAFRHDSGGIAAFRYDSGGLTAVRYDSGGITPFCSLS